MWFTDTLTGKAVEIAAPPKLIGIYNCGLTVSDYAHIGHARNALFSDVIVRFLKWQGYSVKYVSNITDIQDKIMAKAESVGTAPDEVANFFLSAWQEDLNWLEISRQNTLVARASDHIGEIIDNVQKIVESGHAYVQDGWVLFDVSSDPDYGKLSRISREKMLDIVMEKRRSERGIPSAHDGLDFALWQPTIDESPGWDSPWGYGRPGKHIECSAIISKYLADGIDIHIGGIDLLYPHHESEIAQTSAAWGKAAVAKVWLHNAEIQVDGQKMAKSAGNAISLREIRASYDANSIRFLMLQTHYKETMQYSERHIKMAQATWKDLTKVKNESKEKAVDYLTRQQLVDEFRDVLGNDLDTPSAVRLLVKIGDEFGNTRSSFTSEATISSLIEELASVVGLQFE